MFPIEIWRIIGDYAGVDIYKFCFVNRVFRQIFVDWWVSQGETRTRWCGLALLLNIPRFFVAINICDRKFIVDNFEYIYRALSNYNCIHKQSYYPKLFRVISRGELLPNDINEAIKNIRDAEMYDEFINNAKDTAKIDFIKHCIINSLEYLINPNQCDHITKFITKHNIDLRADEIILILKWRILAKNHPQYIITKEQLNEIFEEVDLLVNSKQKWRSVMYGLCYSKFEEKIREILVPLAQKKYLQCSAAEIAEFDKIIEEDGMRYLRGVVDSQKIEIFA